MGIGAIAREGGGAEANPTQETCRLCQECAFFVCQGDAGASRDQGWGARR